MPVVTVPSTWVKPEDRDTGWWVTRQRYKCRVPHFQMYSPEYIKYFGMPDSGDETTNLQMRNELIHIEITIGEMAVYYNDGVQVSIPDPKTTQEIYTRVADHLRAWKEEIEGSLNPGKVPIDDLLLLDKFASALFPHAQRFFPKGFEQSKFARRMGSIVTLTRESFLQPLKGKPVPVDPNKEPEDKPKHASFADLFLARKAQGTSRWK